MPLRRNSSKCTITPPRGVRNRVRQAHPEAPIDVLDERFGQKGNEEPQKQFWQARSVLAVRADGRRVRALKPLVRVPYAVFRVRPLFQAPVPQIGSSRRAHSSR